MKEQEHKSTQAAQRTRRTTRTTAAMAALALLPLVVSLTAGTGTRAGAQDAMSNGLNDAQIVGIVLAADQIDIDYAKLALAKSKDKGVREFAQRMITDHSAVQESVLQLARKLSVRGEESAVSQSLKKGAVEITAKLKSLSGTEFDAFYIENEVKYHKAVTDAVDGVLIPNARNTELRSALQGAQPLFLKHLEHARMIHAETGRGMMGHGK